MTRVRDDEKEEGEGEGEEEEESGRIINNQRSRDGEQV